LAGAELLLHRKLHVVAERFMVSIASSSISERSANFE